MFGVVRRAAADAIGSIEASLVSAEKPGRAEVLRTFDWWDLALHPWRFDDVCGRPSSIQDGRGSA